MSHYKRILVPVDGSETSNKALVQALQLARDGGAQVRLIHAVDELSYLSGYEYSGDMVRIAREHGVDLLDQGLAMAKAAGVAADIKLIEFPGQRLGQVVADEAREWQADLVVLGTHGRRGMSRLMLGSGAEQIIRLSAVPVLVVPGAPGVRQGN
jgi:nucleotide-binding universal stress UspA family protein